jgi:hypothetical protein
VTRAEIAARVDELALRRASFLADVTRFAGELDGREREALGEILLERARQEGAFADAFEHRVQARGWLCRQWEKAGGGDRSRRAAR